MVASADHNGTVIEDSPEVGGQTALPGLSTAADRALRRELEELRLDNARLRKLLELTEAESKAAHLAQAVLPSVVHHGPVTMESSPEAKVRLFQDLFRARNDVSGGKTRVTAAPAGSRPSPVAGVKARISQARDSCRLLH